MVLHRQFLEKQFVVFKTVIYYEAITIGMT